MPLTPVVFKGLAGGCTLSPNAAHIVTGVVERIRQS
jgi:hypothetical protein